MVINKWSVNSLPDEYVLTDRLEKLPLAQINEKTFSHKVVLVLAWFVFPLLFTTESLVADIPEKSCGCGHDNGMGAAGMDGMY